ncbi:MAG: ATP-binding protein [Methanobrevibacter sp.]|nr:ATP-binding protein [Methanobrevibacter sp.]
MKKLALGISTFSEIIEDNYIYVDKTKTIYEMINQGKTYFLSRPRRFGKSLLVSTLKELFNGNKELFKSLYIYDKWDWSEKHPVIHLDFGKIAHERPETLKLSLEDVIIGIAEEYDIILKKRFLNPKFSELIEKLYEKTGKKVVVLVDEYDMAIIDCMKNMEIAKQNRDVLSDFYKVLKASDEYLRFIFLTGVSKFSKTSIFSGLNNLYDISMDSNFSTICGYTQEELENCYSAYIEKFSKDQSISCEKLLFLIKDWYNGYSWDGENRLYNPHSIISLFKKGIFENYWYETGTPSLLMDFIENNPLDADILFKESIAIEGGFPSFDLENIDFSALLLQTGYLTVKSQNIIVGELPSYDLAIPNREVHVSLFTSIIKKISRGKPNQINTLEKKISQAIATLDNKLLQEALDTLIATIPSVIYGKIKKEIREANYHILFLAMLNLIGFFAIGEVSHSKRTLDVVIKKNNLVIVCELKYSLNTPLNDLTSEAMNQIKDYEYYKPYLNYDVILLAVAFGDRKVKSQLEPLKKKKNS